MTDNITAPGNFAGTAWADYQPTQDPTVANWGGSDYDRIEKGITDGLEKTAQGASFAAVRAGGWHQLGTVFDRPATAEELLVTANADYPVFLRPLYAGIEEDSQVGTATVPNMASICRPAADGGVQVLGVGSKNYQQISNREAFVQLGDAVVDVAEPTAATCGVLYGGKRAFMCWRLPQGLMVGGVDAHELWLLVCHAHDLSQPLIAAITPLRTVCQNTERYNLRNVVSRWTMKKTRNAKVQLQQVRDALKLSWEYTNELDKIATELLNTPMTNARFEAIITQEFGPGEDAGKRAENAWDEKHTKLMELFAVADTQANIRGTAWGAAQAVGEYQDWMTKAIQKGWDSPDAYRFWRSVSGEKSTQQPKDAMLRAVREYAGV